MDFMLFALYKFDEEGKKKVYFVIIIIRLERLANDKELHFTSNEYIKFV